MFGSRWTAVRIDHLASTTGVRVICVDRWEVLSQTHANVTDLPLFCRPGMGGSTNCHPKVRIDVWLETVRALLSALDVQHVSILSHSAGTMYAFNTVYRLRDILDPQRPYMAMIAPWVHSDHSNVTLTYLASKIPTGLFGSWNAIARLINTRVAPTLNWSSGIVSSSASLFQTESGTGEASNLKLGELYGVSEEVGKYIDQLKWKWFLAETTTAGNEEALLCLRKSGYDDWGVCDDYESFVRQLAKQEQECRSAHDGTPKLKVDTFFAESDALVGEGGQQYFEQCWEQDGVAEAISFSSATLPGTDHDTALMDLKKGALKTVFERIAGQD